MVDAGIARKVDFGEGRFRFEQGYRSRRHFHLICKTCNESFEFPQLRHRNADRGDRRGARVHHAAERRADLRAVRGMPDREIDSAAKKADHGHADLVFARDALRIAIATERSGLDFYTRAARVTRDARGRKIFQDLASEEKEHLATLEDRYAELLKRDPQLESRPTFLFFKGAAHWPLRRRHRAAHGRRQRPAGAHDRIRCEPRLAPLLQEVRRAVRGFEGKQIFLEFADEERAHLDLLVREYRSLVKRQGRSRKTS
jgi:rubrerythrin